MNQRIKIKAEVNGLENKHWLKQAIKSTLYLYKALFINIIKNKGRRHK